MSEERVGGIAGKLLRVDLTLGKIWNEELSPREWREYLGGVGIGAKIIYEEVGADVDWDHPENRLVMATGPLAGLPVWGTGGLTVVTRGAMTNGATSTQANGFFGSNLKFSGYDGIVLQGEAPSWVYLFIHDDKVELRDATHLLGKDTWETQQALEEETGFSGFPGQCKTPFARLDRAGGMADKIPFQWKTISSGRTINISLNERLRNAEFSEIFGTSKFLFLKITIPEISFRPSQKQMEGRKQKILQR